MWLKAECQNPHRVLEVGVDVMLMLSVGYCQIGVVCCQVGEVYCLV